MLPILIAIYIATFLITYSATFAYFQKTYPTLAKEHYKVDLGFSIVFALIPIAGFIMVLFLSGFYENGFKFK